MVAVDPSTGGVLAYYGGSDGIGFDYAQAWRAPGSSVQAVHPGRSAQRESGRQEAGVRDQLGRRRHAALRPGPGCRIYNDPGDSSVSYPQPITSAMKVSLNTAFARLAKDVGTGQSWWPPPTRPASRRSRRVTAYSAAGQKTLVDSNGSTSVTIGYGSYAVRPIDQAAALATFASGGIQRTELLHRQGDRLVRQDPLHGTRTTGKRAFDAKVANDVTVSMNQVAAWSGDALADGRTSAAKTGTVGLCSTSDHQFPAPATATRGWSASPRRSASRYGRATTRRPYRW